jgi:hypothetical protein
MTGIKRFFYSMMLSVPGLLFEVRWLILVVLLGFVLDCLTAFGLNRRLRRRGLPTSRFSSVKFGESLIRIVIWIVGIFFCHLIDKHVMADLYDLHLANWLTLLISIDTAMSILENLSTASNDRMAQFLQRFLVSKAERHLEVDVNNDGKIEGAQ